MIGKADSARSKAGTISLIAATVLTVIAALPGASADEIQQVDKLRAKAGALAEKALAQQGGSRLVFKVDAKALRDTMVTDLRDRLYRNVHDGRVPFSGLVIREGVVEIRIAGAGDRDRVLTRLTAPSENPSVRGNPLDVVDKGDGVIRLTPTDAAFATNLAMLVGRAMGVIDQRLDDSGIKGAGVLPDGDDRIRLALPGIREPERVASPGQLSTDRRVDVARSRVDDHAASGIGNSLRPQG